MDDMEKSFHFWDAPCPKNHWTLLWRGLDVFFAGFWDLRLPPVLRSHDS